MAEEEVSCLEVRPDHRLNALRKRAMVQSENTLLSRSGSCLSGSPDKQQAHILEKSLRHWPKQSLL